MRIAIFTFLIDMRFDAFVSTTCLLPLFFSVLFTVVSCQQAKSDKKQVSVKVDKLQILKDSLSTLNRLILHHPDNGEFYYLRALVKHQLKKDTAALIDMDSAVKREPNNPAFWYYKGFFETLMTNDDQALKSFLKAVELGCAIADNYHQIGNIFFFKKDYRRALLWYDKAIKMNSKEAQYYFAKAYLYHQEKNWDNMLIETGLALNYDSTHAKTLDLLFNYYVTEKRDLDKALHFNLKLLKSDSLNPLGNFNQGLYFYTLSQQQIADKTKAAELLTKSLAYYDKSIKLDPKFILSYYNRGYAHLSAGHSEQAIQDFESTLQLDSSYYKAHFMLGSTYEYLNEIELAKKHYKRSLALKPDFKEASVALNQL